MHEHTVGRQREEDGEEPKDHNYRMAPSNEV